MGPGRCGVLHLVLAATVLALATLTAAVATHATWLATIDRGVGTRAFELTRSHELLRRLAVADAVLQQPRAFDLLLVLSIIAFATVRAWRTVTWLTAVLVISVVAAPAAKSLLRRPRPSWPDPISTLSDFSYPSGHATAAWAVSTALVLAASLHLRSRWVRCTVIVLAVSAASIVSTDRVLLGVHYPSDVLAGALLGTAIALAPWAVIVRAGPPDSRSQVACRGRRRPFGQTTGLATDPALDRRPSEHHEQSTQERP